MQANSSADSAASLSSAYSCFVSLQHPAASAQQDDAIDTNMHFQESPRWPFSFAGQGEYQGIQHLNRRTHDTAVASKLKSRPVKIRRSTAASGDCHMSPRPANRERFTKGISRYELTVHMVTVVSHVLQLRTAESGEPQQTGQQWEEGVKLLILIAALRDAHKECRVPHREAAQGICTSTTTCTPIRMQLDPLRIKASAFTCT